MRIQSPAQISQKKKCLYKVIYTLLRICSTCLKFVQEYYTYQTLKPIDCLYCKNLKNVCRIKGGIAARSPKTKQKRQSRFSCQMQNTN